MDLSSKNFVKEFEDLARRIHGKGADLLSNREAYETLCRMVMSYSKERRSENVVDSYKKQEKEVYYFSMEFLIGRLLKEYLVNLEILDEVRDGMHKLGFD